MKHYWGELTEDEKLSIIGVPVTYHVHGDIYPVLQEEDIELDSEIVLNKKGYIAEHDPVFYKKYRLLIEGEE